MDELGLKVSDRKTVLPARKKAEALIDAGAESAHVVALELGDGTIITGKRSELMTASAACILNAVKYLSKISDDIHLISPVVIEPIITLKTQVLEGKNGTLTAEEIDLLRPGSGQPLGQQFAEHQQHKGENQCD